MAQSAKNLYPPREETLGDGTNCLVITYDLETTGLNLDDEIIQIGAYTPGHMFSQYMLPVTGKTIHPEATDLVGLEVRPDCLYDIRAKEVLATVSEEEGLVLFLEWLRGQGRGEGVVLVSHGGIFLDVPLLMQALQRNNLTCQFFQVVKGLGDSNAVFQGDTSGALKHLSLQHLYRTLVGERCEVHRADVDAKDLHDLLLQYFQVDALSLGIPVLRRYCYTAQCMLQYAFWKLELDSRMRPLAAIVSSWRKQSSKKKNIVLKNLVLSGYDLQSLRDEYSGCRSGGEFKKQLRQRIQRMKKLHESYLTDTDAIHVEEVVNCVVRYFRLGAVLQAS